jgi:starch synthase
MSLIAKSEHTRRKGARVLFASSEIFPLAKTGGLADVSAALPDAIAGLGSDVRLVMPGYAEALDRLEAKQPAVPLGDILGVGDAALVRGSMPGSALPVWLVDCPALYRRRGGPYADAHGRDWPDNDIRFALFDHAVARLALGAAGAGWRPDVVHLNDWHLGLVPALLAAETGSRPPTVLTIHNMAFQGLFPAETLPRLGWPRHCFAPEGIEFCGQVSFLKAGIRFADRLTTVSPRYAREILMPEFGCGLDGLLRARAGDLVGILNGIDYDGWTPEDATSVPRPYKSGDLSGKRQCKAALQGELGLAGEPNAPLIAFVARLTHQKMADVLATVVPAIVDQGAQLAVCGEGDRSIEETLSALETRYPGRVAVRIGYQEAFARRVLAGADILAAPSRFEPCGLTQMYAMRFGTLPIVRRVGGLADTVTGHEDGDPGVNRDATGFVFEHATAEGLADAVARACRLFQERIPWRAMQLRAMTRDFRWRRSAERYLALYADLLRDDAGEGGEPELVELRPTGT